MGDGIVPHSPTTSAPWETSPRVTRLLDWLAAEFVAGKWSIKAMDRLIVTSSAYRPVLCSRRREGENRSAESVALADEPQTL
jgi:hypothetical protein